jgi:CelD/BcsL family acetyltransferase involved in cellulose biosynthesis
MHLEQLNITTPEWEQCTKDLTDRTVFQSSAWMSFLVETQRGEPIFAALMNDNAVAGYFCGMVVRKFGIPMLGSPMPGWTTAYMGTNLFNGIPRQFALQAITRFAFRELGCVHVEMMDRRLTPEDARELGFRTRLFDGFEIDITQSEAALMANMEGSCRRNIRKAVRCELRIRECEDDSFVDHYCAQLADVFAKDGLVPTYGKKRVRALMHYLLPEGKVLPLQAIDPEGNCIASMLTVASNDTAFLWGSTSWRRFQYLRPNELLMWASIQHWRARGIRKLDMGGGGEYKRKYGGYEISVPWLRVSKYAGLESLRATAVQAVRLQQRVRGFSKLQGSGAGLPPAASTEHAA